MNQYTFAEYQIRCEKQEQTWDKGSTAKTKSDFFSLMGQAGHGN